MPQIGHRTPEISELINSITPRIQNLLYTQNHIYLVSHAATGLWEMGLRNSVKKGVLHAVNGAFSSKWASVSTLENKGYFLDVLQYEKSYGKAQTPSTPSIPHLFGLQKVLNIIDKEGLENRWKRHKDCAEYAHG